MQIELNEELRGRILDVGGGGEGIIGLRYGRQVIAIDNRQEELDEAPDVCEKRLMDAQKLSFPAETFDHVTFFYSIMYMTRDTQEKALAEAYRVLKRGGTLRIWDAEFEAAYPEPFTVDLTVEIDGRTVQTTYGIVKNEAQSALTVCQMAEKRRFTQIGLHRQQGQFFLICRKIV